MSQADYFDLSGLIQASVTDLGRFIIHQSEKSEAEFSLSSQHHMGASAMCAHRDYSEILKLRPRISDQINSRTSKLDRN